jgi:Fe2+ transport system protein B
MGTQQVEEDSEHEGMPENQQRPLTESQREALRLQFEWLKHLTTLTSGIAVALIIVLEIFFEDYVQVGLSSLLVLTFVMLLTGLEQAMIVMKSIPDWLADDFYPKGKVYSFLFFYPATTVVFGVLFFGVYAVSYSVGG